MISYAHEKGLRTQLASNLNQFNQDMAQAVVESHLDLLRVSCYGASQQTAEKYQVGTDFDKVMNNIRSILEEKRARRRKNPVVQWRFAITRYNEHELPKAKRMVKEVGIDRLELINLGGDTSEQVLLEGEQEFETVKEWLPSDERYSGYDYAHKKRKVTLENTCSSLWARGTINWNGSVSACCASWYEEYDFGNVLQGGFKEIWNNEKYRAARKIVARNTESDIRTICHICKRNQAMM